MKKIALAVALTIAGYGCVKCTDSNDIDAAWTRHGSTTFTKVVEIEGHKYVILRGYELGGIVHAASCHCMAK